MIFFQFIIPLFFAFSLFGNTSEIAPQTHYKLYCMYTPQFETLYQDYFLPSLKDDFEIVLKKPPQECPTGWFRSTGWENTMLRKLELLQEAIKENWNQIFFYSDIDIIFLKPILEESLICLGSHDFVVQQGWPRKKLCAGFFVMKGNEKTLNLIMKAYHLLKTKKCVDDQVAIQDALDTSEKGFLSWAFLPSEKFPNGNRVLKKSKEHYSVNSEIEIDDSILLFHANCCIGLENKYHFLTRVQELYSNK